jgi:hypothetical protein
VAILGTFQSLLAPKKVAESTRSVEAAAPNSEEAAKGPDMIAMRDVFVKAPKDGASLKDLVKKSAPAEVRAPAMFRKS